MKTCRFINKGTFDDMHDKHIVSVGTAQIHISLFFSQFACKCHIRLWPRIFRATKFQSLCGEPERYYLPNGEVIRSSETRIFVILMFVFMKTTDIG